MEQPLSPDVEKLLQDLQPEQTFNAARISAAKRLGKLSESDPRVVKALVAAIESDTSPHVRKSAAEALRASAHQEILERHPDLMEKVQRCIATLETSLSAEQPVVDKVSASPVSAVTSKMEQGETVTFPMQDVQHLSNERNWKRIFEVAIVVLILVLAYNVLNREKLPDLSEAVLTSQDFSQNFLEPSLEGLGIKIGERTEEGLKIESAFALASFEPFEMIIGLNTLISGKEEQANFSRKELQSEVLLDGFAEAMKTNETFFLTQPEFFELKAIGEASVGITAVLDMEGDPIRIDTVFFQRDVVGAIIYIMYVDGESPLVTTEDVARKLDERIIEVLSDDD